MYIEDLQFFWSEVNVTLTIIVKLTNNCVTAGLLIALRNVDHLTQNAITNNVL